MAVRDPKTEWLRAQIYRRMTPAERIEVAAPMVETERDALYATIHWRMGQAA